MIDETYYIDDDTKIGRIPFSSYSQLPLVFGYTKGGNGPSQIDHEFDGLETTEIFLENPKVLDVSKYDWIPVNFFF